MKTSKFVGLMLAYRDDCPEFAHDTQHGCSGNCHIRKHDAEHNGDAPELCLALSDAWKRCQKYAESV